MCEKILDQGEKTQVNIVEIDGLKEKLFDLSQNLNHDREMLRKTLKSTQEQEGKIKEMLAKNKDIMGFRDNFVNFEHRVDASISDLYKK